MVALRAVGGLWPVVEAVPLWVPVGLLTVCGLVAKQGGHGTHGGDCAIFLGKQTNGFFTIAANDLSVSAANNLSVSAANNLSVSAANGQKASETSGLSVSVANVLSASETSALSSERSERSFSE